jgi:hypothetical protein
VKAFEDRLPVDDDRLRPNDLWGEVLSSEPQEDAVDELRAAVDVAPDDSQQQKQRVIRRREDQDVHLDLLDVLHEEWLQRGL